jgi:putative phosphoribosyl transferase
MYFQDRRDAGRQLATLLTAYQNRPATLVLGLPRGGVPVAAEVADALQLPLDICLVRKLGVPGEEELAMGAIASGGAQVLNEDIIQSLRISEARIQQVIEQQQAILRHRERAYRGDRRYPSLAGQTIILIDDGIATGASMRAAIASLQQLDIATLIVAVPVAPLGARARLGVGVDEFYCLEESAQFGGVGQFYARFPQLADQEVIDILARHANRNAS